MFFFLSTSRDQVNGQTTFEKEYVVTPLLANNKEKHGLALDGKLKDEDTNLASSSMWIKTHFNVPLWLSTYTWSHKTHLVYEINKKSELIIITLAQGYFVSDIVVIRLFSSCSLQAGMSKDVQGILVSYKIKVSLMVGSAGVLGSLISRLPIL